MNCYICNSKQARHFAKNDSLDVYKCLQCDTVFLYPQPSEEQLKGYYNEQYYFGGMDDLGYSDYFKIGDAAKNEFENRLNTISNFKKGNNLLDVGCAFGYFIEIAQKRGWDVHGSELSLVTFKHIKEKYNVDIHCGPFEEAPYQRNHFDLVTMWDSFEHFQQPIEILRKAKHILKKGGILAMSVPNTNCLLYRLTKRNWEQFKPYHLFYYNKKTLKTLLRMEGFDVVKVETRGITGLLKFMGLINDKTDTDHNQNTNPSQSFIKNIYHKAGKELINKIVNPFGLGESLIVYSQSN